MRLLDWTFSPLVAAHFATATHPGEEVVVWAVDCGAAHRRLPSVLREALTEEGATVFTTELLATHAPTLGAFDRLQCETPFALFFQPPSLDDRIVNQSAVLSVMPGAATSADDWLREHADARHRGLISPTAKAEIRDRLDQANGTERVLIPGLAASRHGCAVTTVGRKVAATPAGWRRHGGRTRIAARARRANVSVKPRAASRARCS
jgi:hypothetical protein